jgi:hypothetical protein
VKPAPFVAAWEGVPDAFPGGEPAPCQQCGAPDPNPGPAWKALANSVHPGAQTFNNCGLQAVYQVVEAKYVAPVGEDEREFLDEGLEFCDVNGSEDSLGATSDAKRQCMLSRHGVASTLQPQTVDKLDAALRERKGVIVNADAAQLWDGQGVSGSGQHAVLVTYGNYDANGVLQSVHVNDTAGGRVEPDYDIPVSRLPAVLASGKQQMNVTTLPVWPSD